jgi:hypothetical protein
MWKRRIAAYNAKIPPGRSAWPESSNPYALTVAQRCIEPSSGEIGAYGLGCRTWYRRPLTTGSLVAERPESLNGHSR